MHIPEVGFNHEKADNAEFEVIELASLYQKEKLNHPPEQAHRVKFFMMLYIEQGTGSHMVDFEQHPFSAGSFIFIQREQVHAFDFSSKPTGKILLFTQDFLDQVHANMRLPNYTPTHLNQQHSPTILLDNATNQRCKVLIEEIIKETLHEGADPLIIMYLFSSLSLILHREQATLCHDKLSQQQNIKFARFIELLFIHFKNIRDANWFASQLNTTYKTLNTICKLATGLTAKQLIDAYTIVEIKRRLVISSITTQQLTYDFGFEDASNFVKYFKKNTQLTPSQFQKQYLKPSL